MLQRPDQYDEDALDAPACATHNWMRFFASLRMTANCGRERWTSPLPFRGSELQLRHKNRREAPTSRAAFSREPS
jgi:hypothetical protein